MNSPEDISNPAGDTPHPNLPDGILDPNFIRQMANKIFQQDLSDKTSAADPAQSAESTVAGNESLVPLKKHPLPPEATPPRQSFYPSDHSMGDYGGGHHHYFLAGESFPSSGDYYFLNKDDLPTADYRPTDSEHDLFDLSGERCVLAPLVSRTLERKQADGLIEAAGKPKDRAPLLTEAAARVPYSAKEPFYFMPLANLSPEEGTTSSSSGAVVDHAGDMHSPDASALYFLQRPSIDALYSPYPAAVKSQTNKPDTKPRIDWSAYRMFHPESVRKDFPALHQTVNGKPLVWLDNAATTQKPQSVIDAQRHFYERDNSNIHRGAHTLAARATDAYEEAREKIRQFIGASSKDEIVYVRGTTEGMNLLANTFGRQRVGMGDEIILSELEHHANIVPWQMLAKEKGARLRVIPINNRGELMLEEYERLFNPRTRLVSISQVSNALGTVVPVGEIISIAHRRGVPVIVDGAQSVQHMSVNVQALDADFFVFSGHKLFGPTGIGAVYGKMEYLEMMPPWQGGGNMIDRVSFEETTYNSVPAKFEAGTPSIGPAIGLGAAIDYVQKIGMENIHRYEMELMEYLEESLRGIKGLQIIGHPRERAGALSFVMKHIPTSSMGQLLDKEGIALRAGHHCAQPALRHFGLESSVRPSLAFYNVKEDIDRLREALLKLA